MPISVYRVPVKVPSAVANFPFELFFVPESLMRDRYHQLLQCTDMPRGGHFAAFEEPEILAEDIVKFIQKVENIK